MTGNGSDPDGRGSLGHRLSHGTHGRVSRERPVSSLGPSEARLVSSFPKRVGSRLNRGRRSLPDSREPWKFTAFLGGIGPRASLDHTSLGGFLPPRDGWDLASIHRYTPNTAYVEGNLDWACKTDLDITRELDRPNGYCGNQPILLQTLDRSDPTPGSLSPHYLNSFIGYSKYTVSQSGIVAQCKPIGIHLLIRIYFVIVRENIVRILFCQNGRVEHNSKSCVSGDSFSRASVVHPHGKVDTPKPRLLRRAHACPDEIKFGCAQPRVRLFASDCGVMNSAPGFGRESSCGKPVGQNGVLTGFIPHLNWTSSLCDCRRNLHVLIVKDLPSEKQIMEMPEEVKPLLTEFEEITLNNTARIGRTQPEHVETKQKKDRTNTKQSSAI
ncbi:hypothetical protein CRG98_013013 [Punica granatum]|uniref:Uncharacterized protein n=1 Tax=Punica granatum TaxID=22663 RepID=A0A2I0KDM1_PUNGR|nr:hypothetical protein CRG98_013013 [Punica granatum]